MIWIGAGIVGFVWPHITIFIVAVLVGWAFLVLGIFDIVNSIRYHYLPYWWAYLIRGIIAVGAGLPLHPAPRRALDGAGRAHRHRGHPLRRRRAHRRLLGPPRHEALGSLQGAGELSARGEQRCDWPASPSRDGRPRPGLILGDEILDLSDAATGLPPTMAELLALGSEGLERARADAGRPGGPPRPAAVRRHAPVPDPPVILAIGMNYRAHVAEMGREAPEWQYWFNKQRTSISGPGDPIVLPSVSDMVDYEGELALVIGPRCQHVPAARAFEVVAGFTIINDVSTRDWQWRTPTFTMGKSFDTHAPCGPELVTGDELGDPGSLAIRTWVNDELRQDSTTADLIFGCADMIEYLTTAFPLEPGTIIATGTPAGVGAGFDPPRFLGDGDTVRISIEGIGELSNPVVQGGPPEPVGLD